MQITILQLINRGFQQLKQFLTNSIDDGIKIKAEITSFNMRYYLYEFDKLRLRVATIKKASCAGVEGLWVVELQVRQLKIGSKSCFAK